MADDPIQMPDLPKSLQKLTMTKSEMAVSKLFSAQWIMAVGVTVGSTFLVILIVLKRPEHASAALTVYFSNWGIIIANYFRRDKSGDVSIGQSKGDGK